MNAIHTLWTKPRIKGDTFTYDAFDIYSAVLSALKWRQFNGNIFMITDTFGFELLTHLGIENAWNGIFTYLDDIPDTFDSKTYWAGGKLFALKKMNSPVACIDTDFIVWKKLEFSHNLCAVHFEEINDFSYPSFSDFTDFAPNMSFSLPPCNTAFTFIGDSDFLKFYTDTSISFMEKYKNPKENPLAYMLFAEQRLFSMCAAYLGISVKALSDLNSLFSQKNETFTHLWGFKEQMRKNPELNFIYCEKFKNRIISDFPDFAEKNGSKLFTL